MLVTDAQIHLWETERADRPWPKDGRSTPHRPNGFTAEQMLAEMDPIGVDRAVIVPPSWIGETNEYALEAVRTVPDPVRGHGPLRLRGPGLRGAAPDLARPAAHARHPDHVQHAALRRRARRGHLRSAFAGCDRYRIPLMALFSGPLLAKVPPIVEKYPGMPLIIDHMGASHPRARAGGVRPHRPAARAGTLPERVRQDDERAEQLGRVVPVPRRPPLPAADVRRLRGAAPDVGLGHHPAARAPTRSACGCSRTSSTSSRPRTRSGSSARAPRRSCAGRRTSLISVLAAQ